MKRLAVISSIVLSSTFMGCGEDSDDATNGVVSIGVGGNAAPIGALVSTSTGVVNYALNALSSVSIGEASSALALLEENEPRSEEFTSCTIHAGPYDADTGERMRPENPLFARTSFKCQLESSESVDAVRGSFEQNYNIICDLERQVGTLEYTEEGKVYETKIQPSLECGWPQKSLDEIAQEAPDGIPLVVTAKSYTTGDWTTSINLSSAEMGLGLTIYMFTSEDSIAFKQVDNWSFAERDGDNAGITDEDATGHSGGTVQINTTTGELRAETVDTYWGRRARMLVTGDFDPATGEFSQITAAEGLQGNFDVSVFGSETGLYAELASVKGNSTDGFFFRSAQLSCSSNDNCDVRTEVDSATVSSSADECYPATAECAGNEGLPLTVSGFWKLGAAFDDQSGSRAAVEAWLETSGLLVFTSVDDASAL